jgi:hypothetical protein
MGLHSSIDHTGLTGVSTLSFGSNVNSVGTANTMGASPSNTRADHVHIGVTSIAHTSNAFVGGVTLVAGANVGITSPSSGTFRIDGGASGGGSSDLSGEELDYVEYTANVSPTATTEATANTVVTANAVSFDGSTTCLIEFYSPSARAALSTNASMFIWLYEDGTSIGRIARRYQPTTTDADTALYAARRMTPASGSRTYSIRASVSTGTGSLGAGVGGAGVDLPGYIRITRV